MQEKLTFSVCTVSYGVYAISSQLAERLDACKQSTYLEVVVRPALEFEVVLIEL